MCGARLAALPVLGLGCVLAACGSPAKSCPQEIPPCPSPAPSLVNESVSLIKNTSLALAIGVADITYQARYIDYANFRGVEALMAVTVFYLGLCTAVAGLGHVLQRRLSRTRRALA